MSEFNAITITILQDFVDKIDRRRQMFETLPRRPYRKLGDGTRVPLTIDSDEAYAEGKKLRDRLAVEVREYENDNKTVRDFLNNAAKPFQPAQLFGSKAFLDEFSRPLVDYDLAKQAAERERRRLELEAKQAAERERQAAERAAAGEAPGLIGHNNPPEPLQPESLPPPEPITISEILGDTRISTKLVVDSVDIEQLTQEFWRFCINRKGFVAEMMAAAAAYADRGANHNHDSLDQQPKIPGVSYRVVAEHKLSRSK